MNAAELRVIRHAIGWTKADIARVACVSESQVSRWEHPGRKAPVPEQVAELVLAEWTMVVGMADSAVEILESMPAEFRFATIEPGVPRTLAVAALILSEFPDIEIRYR